MIIGLNNTLLSMEDNSYETEMIVIDHSSDTEEQQEECAEEKEIKTLKNWSQTYGWRYKARKWFLWSSFLALEIGAICISYSYGQQSYQDYVSNTCCPIINKYPTCYQLPPAGYECYPPFHA